MINQIYKVTAPGYVAAIIQGTYQLSLWLDKVPESLLNNLLVEPMTGVNSYPVTLFEFKTGERVSFIGTDSDGKILKDQLKACHAKILATYTINKDFLGDPKNPGKDYMGVLDHVHED